MEEGNVITTNTKALEYWKPTVNFRFLKNPGYVKPTLQQMWQGNLGTEEWREIEIVEWKDK